MFDTCMYVYRTVHCYRVMGGRGAIRTNRVSILVVVIIIIIIIIYLPLVHVRLADSQRVRTCSGRTRTAAEATVRRDGPTVVRFHTISTERSVQRGVFFSLLQPRHPWVVGHTYFMYGPQPSRVRSAGRGHHGHNIASATTCLIPPSWQATLPGRGGGGGSYRGGRFLKTLENARPPPPPSHGGLPSSVPGIPPSPPHYDTAETARDHFIIIIFITVIYYYIHGIVYARLAARSEKHRRHTHIGQDRTMRRVHRPHTWVHK